jgi:hypothetical protein
MATKIPIEYLDLSNDFGFTAVHENDVLDPVITEVKSGADAEIKQKLASVENKKITYPSCVRTEGIGPSQYGTKGLIDTRLAEMEEKYDLQPNALSDGFGEEGEDDNESDVADEVADDSSEDFV